MKTIDFPQTSVELKNHSEQNTFVSDAVKIVLFMYVCILKLKAVSICGICHLSFLCGNPLNYSFVMWPCQGIIDIRQTQNLTAVKDLTLY